MRNMFGLETIAFQKDNICDVIAKLTSSLRDKLIKPDDYIAELSTILTKRFGLNIRVIGDESSHVNAYAYLNPYTRSNPVYDPLISNKYKNVNVIGDKKIITAVIDKKNAKISGNINDYPCYLGVTIGLIYGRNSKGAYYLTADEVAAIIAHEVGHLFTTIEYLIDSTHMSTVIKTRTEELLGRTGRDRVTIIQSDKELQTMSKADKEDLSSVTTKEGIEVILLRYELTKYDDQLGMKYYSARYAEQAADMFAIRCGASNGLATALNKMNGPMSKEGSFFDMTVSILGSWLLSGIPIIIAAIGQAFFTDEYDYYDDPQQRNQFIKRGLVAKLKMTKNPKERATIAEDIRNIDLIYNYVKEQPKGFFHYTNYLLLPSYRRNTKQAKTMKELEELIDNNLYGSSAILNNLNS